MGERMLRPNGDLYLVDYGFTLAFEELEDLKK